MECVVVTGLSGAGRTSALRALEDMGYFAVDNLPLPLLPELMRLYRGWGQRLTKVAVGVDVRREEYEFGGPAQWAQGNAYVFGPPGDAANYMTPKQRDVKAVFAEFNIPVFDSLELNVAGRRDEYDGFGLSQRKPFAIRGKRNR